MRRQRPDALIQHIHDQALRGIRQRLGEKLRQHKGCAQIGFHMPIPGIARGIMPFIAFEGGGVVDQHTERAKRLGRIRDQPRHFGFLTQFGGVPVTLPWEDIEVAMQTGELDGIAWSGITEVYTVGWSNVTNYFLTNNISGAWIGHFFANMDRWNELPPHLQELLAT